MYTWTRSVWTGVPHTSATTRVANGEPMRATYAAAERGHRDAGRCHAVVVPVCQDIDVLRLFLDSLVETVEESTQIIAVNDGSGEAAQELLHERLSAVKAVRDDVTYEILWHDRPEGCARSINEALRLAAGRYVYLVDSDLMLLPGWQSGLRATLDSADTVGMTGAVLLYPQTGGIQHCGIAFTASLGRHLLLNGRPETLPAGRYEVQAVVFALFAMKRSVL